MQLKKFFEELGTTDLEDKLTDNNIQPNIWAKHRN